MLNDRIEYDNKFGTIRYIGPVDKSDHIWYGIEWDDPTRGKHDGMYKGTKYFETKYPSSGSFVKPDGCKKSQSFFDAILAKYCISDEDMKEEIKFGSKTANVQYKTNENSIRLRNLTSALTFNQQVKSLGDANLVLTNCPNIREIDLSNNLIAYWSDVARIVLEIPNLVKLILNGNRLILDDKNKSLDNEVNVKYDCFEKVTMLCLKDMDLNWNDVRNILSQYRFVDCRELYLCGNRITNFNNVESFYNVQHIDLENNRLTSWGEVLKLGELPNLTTLQLNNCGLTDVYFPNTRDISDDKVNPTFADFNEQEKAENGIIFNKTSSFIKLENLYLADNKIDKMKSVDELNRLCNLKYIRLSRNPIQLLFPNDISFRSDVIARIGEITSLNGGKILTSERKGSEIDFVNSCTQHWLLFLKNWSKEIKTGNPHREFSVIYPRFFQLVKKYRVNLEEEKLSKQEVVNLKSNLINLTFLFLKNESLAGNWKDRFYQIILNEICLAMQNVSKKETGDVTVKSLTNYPTVDNIYSNKKDILNDSVKKEKSTDCDSALIPLI